MGIKKRWDEPWNSWWWVVNPQFFAPAVRQMCRKPQTLLLLWLWFVAVNVYDRAAGWKDRRNKTTWRQYLIIVCGKQKSVLLLLLISPIWPTKYCVASQCRILQIRKKEKNKNMDGHTPPHTCAHANTSFFFSFCLAAVSSPNQTILPPTLWKTDHLNQFLIVSVCKAQGPASNSWSDAWLWRILMWDAAGVLIWYQALCNWNSPGGSSQPCYKPTHALIVNAVLLSQPCVQEDFKRSRRKRKRKKRREWKGTARGGVSIFASCPTLEGIRLVLLTTSMLPHPFPPLQLK